MRPGLFGSIVFFTNVWRNGIFPSKASQYEKICFWLPSSSLPEAGAVDGAVEEVEHEAVDILGRVDAEPIRADRLHQPLRVPHQVGHGVLLDRVAVERLGEVERKDLDALLAGPGVKEKDRLEILIGVEAAVVDVGHVGDPAEGGLGPRCGCRSRSPAPGSG